MIISMIAKIAYKRTITKPIFKNALKVFFIDFLPPEELLESQIAR
jgi:hypothetical protein